ncbi:fungal-specific transcription factor domain-containing protein [Thelonectria olida]|uniref:Fungal-specific transcription factor domain-containing protein n=1 Tax=Thelonectria olida TaxID=1576542 RepID=A0A9P8W3E4_9HYPO|nr:fungal-specific transcription factor domain-containing protein [Thelonectria olida]
MSADTIRAKKGCWSCKARKVQCDRRLPTCQKCARARRECQGYGLRLSWPRDGDKKRAITGTSPEARSRGIVVRLGTDLAFVNTTWRDIELHRHLSLQTAMRPLRLVQPTLLSRQPQSIVKHVDLVQYFHEDAHLSLVTFDSTTQHVRDSLMRMALSHDTLPGRALFYALLAVSSLRRSGLHQETVQFKVYALHALSASAREGALSPIEAMQHVGACMLLSTFEILLPSESSGEWLHYTRGAVDIIEGTGLEQKLDKSKMNHLLDWVYYHNALSRFAMYHWRHDSVALSAADAKGSDPQAVQYPPLVKNRPISPSRNPAHEILNLLSETCNTLLDPRDPKSLTEEYKARLKALEQRIRNVPTTQTSANADSDADARLPVVVELYQISTLIYLVRASESPWEPSAMLESLVVRAFAIAAATSPCRHFFPLFIVACEARTDEQRAFVINVIDKTAKGAHMRSMEQLRAEIESIWVQQDLYSDSELLVDYIGLMNAVVSSNNTIPSYA